MARSSYIYIIRRKDLPGYPRVDGSSPKILGVYTVKKEAHRDALHELAVPLDAIELVRYRNGLGEGEVIPWDKDLIEFYRR